MISEGPCDIEDCNNAENTAMHYINKLHLKINNSLYLYFTILHFFTVLLIKLMQS